MCFNFSNWLTKNREGWSYSVITQSRNIPGRNWVIPWKKHGIALEDISENFFVKNDVLLFFFLILLVFLALFASKSVKLNF